MEKQLTGKQPDQHRISVLIFSKKMLVQDSPNALGVDFSLKIDEKVGVVLFLVDILFELALVAHFSHDMLVDRIDWSLVALISFICRLDDIWCCAKGVYGQDMVDGVVCLELAIINRNLILMRSSKEHQRITRTPDK